MTNQNWWDWENPMALIATIILTLIGLILIWVIIKWEKIVAWWTGEKKCKTCGLSEDECECEE